MSDSQHLTIKLQTLTPLWTGGVDGTTDRLHETGLIGSLRWWYEALVRGLGGYACDPTSDDRCPDKDGKRCAACELFGCTGWARKFRLRVLDSNMGLITDTIQSNQEVLLEFVELRLIKPDEKWLLVKAIEIAARYGSLGGKTTLKPQKGPMGDDYGIVKWLSGPQLQRPKNISAFLKNFREGNNQPVHPRLDFFWFVSGTYLSRLPMNSLLHLNKKGHPLPDPDKVHKFLRGRRGTPNLEAISKKLFSFRIDNGRIWGYALSRNLRDEIIKRVRSQLGQSQYVVKTGEEVLNEL